MRLIFLSLLPLVVAVLGDTDAVWFALGMTIVVPWVIFAVGRLLSPLPPPGF